jgi:hypothetical protein
MSYQYRPRRMPRRFMEQAPEIVRAQVLDIIRIEPAAPLDFDLILKPEPNAAEIVGVDFDHDGARGCHFFLKPHEMRAYRERNRRKRIAWHDLPAATQSAIVAYLES